nr:sodium:dicarboxylate symporter family [uncultured bacterium]ALS91606.1 sodium:dicarboxylate symporter family [uncultured bacterium]
MHYISDFISSITLRSVLLGLGIFIVTFGVNLVIVSIILVKLPKDYFQEDNSPKFLKDSSPIVRTLAIVGKNLLGVLLVLLGIALSLPGVPGQGLLTILLGIMCLDIPGRRRLERWIVSRPSVFKAINKLRHRFSKPPLIL